MAELLDTNDVAGIVLDQAAPLIDASQAKSLNRAQALPQVGDGAQPAYNGLDIGVSHSVAYELRRKWGTSGSEPIFTFANEYTSGQTDTATSCRVSYLLGIEYPLGVPVTPAYYQAFAGGSRALTLEPGAQGDFDPLPFDFVAGEDYLMVVQPYMTDGWAAEIVATPSTASGTLAAATYTYRVEVVIDGVGRAFGFKASNGDLYVTAVLSGTGKVDLSWTANTSVAASRIRYKVYRGTTSTNQVLLYTTTADGEVSYSDTGAVSPSGTMPNHTWGTGQLATSGDQEGKISGFPVQPLRDYTLFQNAIGTSTTNCPSPISIRGKATTPSVWVGGDSIAFGSTDSGSIDKRGWVRRVLLGNCGWINDTKGSTTLTAFVTLANSKYRRRNFVGIDRAIMAWITNDIGTGRTYAQIVADIETFIALCDARGIEWFVCDILPRTDLTAGQETIRTQVNTYIWSLVRHIRLTDVLETAPNSGVQVSGMFADAVHPDEDGMAAIAAGTDLVVVDNDRYGWSRIHTW